MEKLYELFAKAIAGACLLVVILSIGGLLAAFPLKWAWNFSMPGIFGLKEIGFWEAFCLLWITSAFFKAAPK